MTRILLRLVVVAWALFSMAAAAGAAPAPGASGPPAAAASVSPTAEAPASPAAAPSAPASPAAAPSAEASSSAAPASPAAAPSAEASSSAAPASPAAAAPASPAAASPAAGSPLPRPGGAPGVGRAQGRNEGNPMFGDGRPSLELRERIVIAVSACLAALYVLFLVVRQLFRPASPPPAEPTVDEAAPPTASDLLEKLDRLNDLHVFLIYLGVALIVTFPAVFRMGSHVVGDNASDVWKHVWGYWWVKTALFQSGRFPLFTADINAPYGGSLYCIDPLNALVSVPLQLVLPLPMAFNVIVLLQLAFGAWAAYRLVAYIVGSRACALPAGIVYGFSPYVMAYPLTSGVTETLNVGWIPLAVLYWLRTLREGTWRNALRLALFVFLTVFSSFYYGAFLMMLLMVMTAGAAVPWLMQLARASSPARGEEARRVWRHGVLCVAGTAIGLAMAALPVYSFFWTIKQTDSIIPTYVREREKVQGEYMALISRNYATLLSYVMPGKDRLQSTYTADRLSRTTYLGYTVLLWALLGLLSGGWAVRAMLLTAFFVLVSLGPFMVISESIHLDTPTSPVYLLLYRVVPLFASIAIPYRMALMVYLFASIAMAFGLARVLRDQPVWMQNVLGLALAFQVLLEFAIASPAPYPAPLASSSVPAFYVQLGRDTRGEAFSVLDLPPTRWNTELTPGEYFLYQTVHGKSIPYSISGTFWQSLLSNGFTKMLCFPHAEMPPGVPPPATDTAAWLRHNNFRYVVVHTSMMNADDVRRVDEVLARYLGAEARVKRAEDGLHVFRVPAARP